MGKRLIRTDKNGTKYWENDDCPKCGGSGDYAWLKVLEGKQFTLKGTIKAHTEREGLKETRLNRCKFVFAA